MPVPVHITSNWSIKQEQLCWGLKRLLCLCFRAYATTLIKPPEADPPHLWFLVEKMWCLKFPYHNGSEWKKIEYENHDNCIYHLRPRYRYIFFTSNILCSNDSSFADVMYLPHNRKVSLSLISKHIVNTLVARFVSFTLHPILCAATVRRR